MEYRWRCWMRRKTRPPSNEERFKLRSHDEFGQMQPLWYVEDLQRLQGVTPRKTGRPKIVDITHLYYGSPTPTPAPKRKATTKRKRKKT
jgi:hypothetical protein